MGDKATALTPYRNGISAHIDFVNSRNSTTASSRRRSPRRRRRRSCVGDRSRDAGSAHAHADHVAEVHRAVGMGPQRDLDGHAPLSLHGHRSLRARSRVYPGFAPPDDAASDNGGKIVQRIRPRFNSEYVWNRPGLDAIGGLALDYHTKPSGSPNRKHPMNRIDRFAALLSAAALAPAPLRRRRSRTSRTHSRVTCADSSTSA
jgi:hypothetical protein